MRCGTDFNSLSRTHRDDSQSQMGHPRRRKHRRQKSHPRNASWTVV